MKRCIPPAIKGGSVHKDAKVEPGSSFISSSINAHSFCGYNCDINSADIGKFCSIANHVVIGGGMHPVEWISSSPAFYRGRDSIKFKAAEHSREPVKRTQIGHDVWIGQNALIKQGISVGTGAVIGMGSVVTKDVPAYSIVAGNPARLIRYRFDQKIIARLLKSEWWNCSDAILVSLGAYAKSPESFLENMTDEKETGPNKL